MHRARGDGPPGGDECLGGNLSTEDPLDGSGRALPAKQIDLDRLKIEQFEERSGARSHAREATLLSIMAGPDVTTAGESGLSDRIRHFLASAHFQKLWRYMAVSVITTVLTLVLLYVFYRGLNVGGKNGVTLPLIGVHVSSAELANVLATGVSTIPSFTLNRKWAWGKSGKSHIWREVVPFWVIAVISLVLSTWVVGVASREAVHLSTRREVQTILVEIGNLATYGAMWIAKYFLFNKLLFQGGERTGRDPLLERDGTAATPAPVQVTATGVEAEVNPSGGSVVNGRASRPARSATDGLAERPVRPAADAG